jgi:bifunctional DNA-binding transcriptional regulator/antitoxin component of YhaV-PrlF toxin-antitoxin module
MPEDFSMSWMRLRALGPIRWLAVLLPPAYPHAMTATVTKELQVALPLDLCEQLGIKPGVLLDFRVCEGKLEAVKVGSSRERDPGSLAEIYTPARNAEEMVIQAGCSCEVPEDFPR